VTYGPAVAAVPPAEHPTGAPLRAVVLGAWPGLRTGLEEWRPYGAWAGDDRADDRLAPSVEVWVRHEPEVKAWLARAEEADVVELELVPPPPADLDRLALAFTTPGARGLDVAVPRALLELTARAAILGGDPLVLTVTTTPGPLEPLWWARTPDHDPDLTFVTEPAALRAAVVRAGR
jgi:hypothetical protein